ncbi:multifunctional acyl-CoA thioesterase I/protease I/lysophospholipase L1 [Vibrio gazogenes]|uniref:Acyl-CoA thioesterase-1 n=1 Tax=Vibrio gazogenes DSM 21264 = NBRC 103151 TaxID=1123492 RepID=A0A1M4VIF1_VIBGA|nr:multifunctional acyl-CoA thioesterase I/protease I/lysophospholipase L1 [Vibrio gazogenes]USP15532.1 multifunctional acyl-CoA thioesterase I/protease I/lysophospholipase L1 [Vibrio gazogenes]SHE68801.1 acyl-CoA thioesterase-1 [Vibrio gazogenes DSM 21264] [Vibrio gazogenes DSM 21264 = NBRC 103151]SJN58580.1 Arylesterase precursor [Vibrio gazogenes]
MRWLSFLLVLTCSLQAHSATRLLIVGDSLSAGYQMSADQAWPSLLPQALQKYNRSVTVVNASVSGDTTGNSLVRLPQLLQQHTPDYVLLELGANDGLRGFSPQIPQQNLAQMIDLITQSGAQAILMQIRIPPNYGQRYSKAFAAIYPTLATEKKVSLLPFFLEQVIVRPEWIKSDGLHPNEQAQPWIAEWMAQHLHPLLEQPAAPEMQS